MKTSTSISLEIGAVWFLFEDASFPDSQKHRQTARSLVGRLKFQLFAVYDTYHQKARCDPFSLTTKVTNDYCAILHRKKYVLDVTYNTKKIK
jgi:hypothetical protein